MKKETDITGRYILPAFCVIVTAFLLRLIGLDSSSLTLNESENALAALNLFGNGRTGQLLYALPTALLFKMFGDSDFTARLFPALMGSLAVFIPFSLARRYGRSRMLLLSFLLAVDPVLLFWSKRADAVIPALVLSGAALAFYLNGHRTAALSCLFIALCSGARCLPALVIFCAGTAVLCLIRKRKFLLIFTKKDLLSAVLSALVFITACTALPSGLASFGRGIADTLRISPAWTRPGAGAVLMALIVYCGIPLLLFISGRFRRYQFELLCVTIAGSILLLLWQGITAIPWITALLLAGSLDRLSDLADALRGRFSFGTYLAAGAVMGGFSFIYFRAVEVFNQTNGYDPVRINWNGAEQILPLTRIGASVLLLLGGMLIVGLIVKILLGFSDSEPIRRGLLFGCAAVCCWGLVTNIWNAGGFDRIGDHPASPHLMNSFQPLGGNYTAFRNSSLLEIIRETEEKYGDRPKENFGLDLAADPLLEWKLRRETEIRNASVVPSDPAAFCMILDRSGVSFSEYGFVGMVLADRYSVNWDHYGIMDWGKWLLFGDGITAAETPLNLWVKGNYILSRENAADSGESE